MDWTGFSREKIDLTLPLLIVKGSKGFLACGYINVETCNKTAEACAIVTGVKTHEEMLDAPVRLVSRSGERLGVKINMTGKEVLEIFR